MSLGVGALVTAATVTAVSASTLVVVQYGPAFTSDGASALNDPTNTATVDRRSNPSTQSQPSVTVVQRVVDGDTIVLMDGRRVRLIGIDTPEAGECGYNAAKRKLTRRVEGRSVTLVNPKGVQGRDRYSRLLRFVERGGVDAGFVLLRDGLAAARYDSRDGYDRHPRQAKYRSTDRRVTSACERRERRAAQRLRRARSEARQAGLRPRPDETVRDLRRRTKAAVRRQERRSQAPAPPDNPSTGSSTGGSFSPPAGWTTDVLTPGYSGCRQGYPGGLVSGVYVWKPIPC